MLNNNEFKSSRYKDEQIDGQILIKKSLSQIIFSLINVRRSLSGSRQQLAGLSAAKHEK